MKHHDVLSLALALSRMSEAELVTLFRLRSCEGGDYIESARLLLNKTNIVRSCTLISDSEAEALLRLGNGEAATVTAADLPLARLLALVGLTTDGDLAPLADVTRALAVKERLASSGGGASKNIGEIMLEIINGSLQSSVPPAPEWWNHALTRAGVVVNAAHFLLHQWQNIHVPDRFTAQMRKELAAQLRIGNDDVRQSVAIAKTVGLLDSEARLFAYLELDHAERWFVLSRAALASMPLKTLVKLLRGEPTIELELARLHSLEDLGITADGQFTELGALVLRGARQEAVSQVAQCLPEAGEQFIVQPDFSVIAPSVLNGAAETLLMRVGAPRQLGVASVYEITEQTLSRAVANGLSLEKIRAELAARSTSELPQALEFTLTELADKLTSVVKPVRVTRSRSAEPEVLEDDLETPVNFADTLDYARAAAHASELLRTRASGSAVIQLRLQLALAEQGVVTMRIKHSSGERELRAQVRGLAQNWVRALNVSTDSEVTLPLAAVLEVL
ncbi:helicase-associated domain-containing protein [Canibacter sp. lx-45]|uniref:helicase-associated domain-containing protein n=1 Tax=Canibacter zhuwentaonis TaxID=2837491 RepID=UPI001BDC169A|nr:helicase-associated domain-containing protein [Canibacter zhuwentaonis]MBT1035807.1 helicase-associated domain-containing protein [Canibacter zhuwentaonis]